MKINKSDVMSARVEYVLSLLDNNTKARILGQPSSCSELELFRRS